MNKKYIPLFGGTFMLLAFFSTIKVTLLNSSDTNVIISLALLVLSVFALYKFFTFDKKDNKKSTQKEEFTPVYD